MAAEKPSYGVMMWRGDGGEVEGVGNKKSENQVGRGIKHMSD